MSSSSPTSRQTQVIALALARADDEYRGFEPFPEPPPDADPTWYHEHVEGWPWYQHMASSLLTQPHLHAMFENKE